MTEADSQINLPLTPTRSTPDHRWADALLLAGFSFLILFFELALIRYVSAYVRVFGYYLNFVLIATFLGMGVGLLRAGMANQIKWLAPVAGVTLFAVVKYFSNVVVSVPDDQDEFLWGVFFEIAPTVRRVGILPTVTVLFALCVMFFIPLGALLGDAFRRFQPLYAYSIDIVGSLLGIVTFGILSWLRLPRDLVYDRFRHLDGTFTKHQAICRRDDPGWYVHDRPRIRHIIATR